MNARVKKIAVMLVIFALSMGLSVTSVRVAYASGSGGKIDVFTQQSPYSGRGANMSSDAFGPDDVVVLYAAVTYNDNPVGDKLVSFETVLPNGTSFTLSSETNSSGVAVVNFTTPTPGGSVKEADVFGVWSVVGRVSLDGLVFQDALTFKVNWIVKLISVETINQNLTHQSEFSFDSDVGLKITMRSVAMSLRSALIGIVIQDALKVPVSFQNILSFEVPPNEKPISIYTKLSLPKWTYVGNATVFVCALTGPKGVPYCPEVMTNFSVNPQVPQVKLRFVDAATVFAAPSFQSIQKGEPLNVTVVVANEGTETISFNVSAFCGGFLIGTSLVDSLSPYSALFLSMSLDTSSIPVGNYTISASIPALPNETDLADNVYVDGLVSIEPSPPSLFHDVAVVSVQPWVYLAYVGDVVNISVGVKNEGNYTESFSVTAFYNMTPIGVMSVNSLQAGANETLVFSWSTQNVAEGNYTISAYASPVAGEQNLANNYFVDHTVRIESRVVAAVHDVAVLNVVPSSTSVFVGDVLNVSVVVGNEGTVSESFNVTLYYGQSIAGTMQEKSLAAGNQATLTFHWNTTGVAAGNYTLAAFAVPVVGETNISNNYFVDGTVRLVQRSTRALIPLWFYWFLLSLLLALALILSFLWFYYRRQKKKSEESFYSGWTAWYYSYNMHPETRRTKA